LAQIGRRLHDRAFELGAASARRDRALEDEVPVDGPLGLGRIPHLLAQEVDGRAQAAHMQRPRDREGVIEGLARHVAEGTAARRRRDRGQGADQALVGVAGGEAEEEAAAERHRPDGRGVTCPRFSQVPCASEL
jgi:hypothetical protein